MEFAVEVKDLCKTFSSGWFRKRKKEALKGIDLIVPVGAMWGILGPNGAGKTTLLSILSNLLTPEQGEVRILGLDFRTNGNEIRKRINLSSGHANFLWSMSVQENLKYYAMLYGLSGKSLNSKIETVMDMFSLKDFARVRFEELSTGTKQKLSLAKALINEPELLFLDEPTVGLDPDVTNRIRDIIKYLHQEKKITILITTHNMKEAEFLCEEVAFIINGSIKAKGSPQDLKEKLHLGDTILIDFKGLIPAAALKAMDGIYDIQIHNSSCKITVDNHRKRLAQILEFFTTQNIMMSHIHIKESDLEDVFISFTR